MTANPTLLTMPLAQNGQKNVIPATQATAGDGLFSQSTGFPAETSLPLGAGGVAPSREDFNGLANLLGGVAFMAQKGFTFNYDATQDYYTGCIVIDPTDGLRYECIADMAAGTIAPSADTANTYWTIFKSGLDREQIPAFNHRDVVTTSGTYTAPVTGWYKITVKGGGGGGSASGSYNSRYIGGGGGGEGGTTLAIVKMDAGDTATVVIGAGGAGGTGNIGVGANGGSSSVVYSGNTYTATGGGGAGNGSGYDSFTGGIGGTGTINGCSGTPSGRAIGDDQAGGTGGGTGGGICPSIESNGLNGATNSGAGGAGGGGGSTVKAGGNGGDGYVWFEYFAAV